MATPVVAADAGDDVTVRAGARVALDGTGSLGLTLTYAWTQTGGPTVTLDDATFGDAGVHRAVGEHPDRPDVLADRQLRDPEQDGHGDGHGAPLAGEERVGWTARS